MAAVAAWEAAEAAARQKAEAAVAAVAAWEGERRRAGEAEERAKKAEEMAEKNKEEAQLWYGRAHYAWKTADEELQGKLKAQAEEAKAREAAAAAMKEVTRALALVTVTGVTINGD